MGQIGITGSSGGADTDGLTAVATHVLKGETFYGAGSDEQQTGTMTVNSLLSFSCAAYSGRRILAKWQNPKAATGKPYSGVIIRYSTSGYPGKTGGTQIYKGAGSNTTSGGQSQQYIDLPALNTTYYFSCIPYVTCSAGEMMGEPLNATVKTSAQITKTITSTQNYTIPAGYSIVDIFCVGGGGGGSGGSKYIAGGGGAGGYTKTVKGISVSSGQVLACTIGVGGAKGSGANTGSAALRGGTGGATSVTRSGTTLCSASGGVGAYDIPGASGGSGGGEGCSDNANRTGYVGGSNGGNGNGTGNGGKGQGTTTRAFGESSGTLYSGGGGGTVMSISSGASGGSGGGGHGGGYSDNTISYGVSAGGSNTGGGGGGGGGYPSSGAAGGASKGGDGGAGGSGIIILRLR